MPVCRRNWEATCTCAACLRTAERMRAASDGPLSVIEREEADDER